jgi:hypothetical protein
MKDLAKPIYQESNPIGFQPEQWNLRHTSDGNQTISFYIIKNSYKQAISTGMVALKSPNNALNLCEIVNKI